MRYPLQPHARRTIALDVDEVLLDGFDIWLREYRLASGHNLRREQIRCWDLSKYVLPGWERRIYELRVPALYLLARPIPGAVAGVRELARQGHRLIAITNDSRAFVPAKRAALTRYFPDLRDIVIAKDKLAVLPRVDVRIDDGLHNQPTIIYPQPWNEDAELGPGQVRVPDWDAIPRLFDCC